MKNIAETAIIKAVNLLKNFSTKTVIYLFLFAFVLLTLAYQSLFGKNILYGDGIEYILQTQSIVFDHSIKIDTAARKEYWNETNPYGVRLWQTAPPVSTNLTEQSQARGGFGGLYPDRFGNYRYYHYWLYSAIVSPVYYVFHVFSSSGTLEYLSFRFINCSLLMLFLLFSFKMSPYSTTLITLFLLLFTPLIPYSSWQHPEIFCFALIFIAFSILENKKISILSPILLGLAASMNAPIILFFPVLFIINFKNVGSMQVRPICKLLAAYAIGSIIAISPLIYYIYYFNTPNVIAHIGLASIENASISRVIDLFINPCIGAIIFFPMLFFILPSCLKKDNWLIFSLIFTSVIAASWLATSTSNFNSGQIGTVRYIAWLLAPLWYFLFKNIPKSFAVKPEGYIAASGLILSILFIIYFKTYKISCSETVPFAGTKRARQEVANIFRISGYLGDPEILAENILGKEIADPSHFNSVYLWDLGQNSYIWIFPECTIKKTLPLIFISNTPEKVKFNLSPKQIIDFDIKDHFITVNLYNNRVKMHNHPVFGNYLIIKSKGEVSTILRNQPYRTRSDRINQVQKFYQY